MRFHVKQWAAWAPGLTTSEAWLAWAPAPFAPVGPEVPALPDVPAMARRRIERLGRLAYHVAAACEGDDRGLPAVFASRHGDVARSIELLKTMAQGETLSPTSFGLSVHNAIGGQYSITRQDPANVVSIAAGPLTAEAGAVEAWGLLQDHPDVLLVVYDVTLPLAYSAFADEPAADFASPSPKAARAPWSSNSRPSPSLGRPPRPPRFPTASRCSASSSSLAPS